MVSQPVRLPSTAELPCSDDTPVDNEDQNLLPNLLLFVLASIWAERMDWYFGVDMAVYHTTGVNPRVPVVPDAFLSLGVERRRASRDDDGETEGRLSYALWEESGIAPIMVLEMVSKTPGDEYDKKLEIYRRLGVLYYVVYNPKHCQRDRHLPFEVYKLVEGPEGRRYQLQMGEPYWMPEVGLGIGRTRQLFGGIEMEMLLWHDEQGVAYRLPEDAAKQLQSQVVQLQQQLEAERRQKAQLADYLRSLGIDPDNLPEQT